MENYNYENEPLENAEQTDKINRNYLPNLSEYQQISYHTKTDEMKKEMLYILMLIIKMNQRKVFIYFIIII